MGESSFLSRLDSLRHSPPLVTDLDAAQKHLQVIKAKRHEAYARELLVLLSSVEIAVVVRHLGRLLNEKFKHEVRMVLLLALMTAFGSLGLKFGTAIQTV